MTGRADYFWAKVQEGGECWEWTATRNQKGYGRFWDGKRLVSAHRWAYEQLVAEIPEGLEIDHLCKNRACVNPWHMEPKTHRANVLAIGSAHWAVEKMSRTHCPRSHRLHGANLRPAQLRRGVRACRTCERTKARVKYAQATGRQLSWETAEAAVREKYQDMARDAV